MKSIRAMANAQTLLSVLSHSAGTLLKPPNDVQR
jgi:hypothetical protein